jgi:hypothetical protein
MATENRRARIERERREMNLRPWQRAPSEVTDDALPPYPVGAMGRAAWLEAQQWRRQIRERDPRYFDPEVTDEYWREARPTVKGRK